MENPATYLHLQQKKGRKVAIKTVFFFVWSTYLSLQRSHLFLFTLALYSIGHVLNTGSQPLGWFFLRRKKFEWKLQAIKKVGYVPIFKAIPFSCNPESHFFDTKRSPDLHLSYYLRCQLNAEYCGGIRIIVGLIIHGTYSPASFSDMFIIYINVYIY